MSLQRRLCGAGVPLQAVSPKLSSFYICGREWMFQTPNRKSRVGGGPFPGPGLAPALVASELEWATGWALQGQELGRGQSPHPCPQSPGQFFRTQTWLTHWEPPLVSLGPPPGVLGSVVNDPGSRCPALLSTWTWPGRGSVLCLLVRPPQSPYGIVASGGGRMWRWTLFCSPSVLLRTRAVYALPRGPCVPSHLQMGKLRLRTVKFTQPRGAKQDLSRAGCVRGETAVGVQCDPRLQTCPRLHCDAHQHERV